MSETKAPAPHKMPSDSWLREHPRNAHMRLEIKGADDNSRVITGIANTGTPDRMGDICDPSGASWKCPFPLLHSHDYAQVIGNVQSLKRTPAGLSFVARVAKVDAPATLRDRVDEIWQLVRSRLLTSVSIGFRPTKWRPRENGEGMIFEAFEILELSITPVPADAGAIIQSVAEAAEFSDVQRALADEPAWMRKALAPVRARIAAERRNWKPDPVVRLDGRRRGVVKL